MTHAFMIGAVLAGVLIGGAMTWAPVNPIHPIFPCVILFMLGIIIGGALKLPPYYGY